ncbi:MAG TPA: ankyrin repeat domain-containing protein [Candidatus Saccharimonadales bacterium]|nr:ankyrin repeat domain-containing protein [Candidatus Saccharimonadales bacterium]
MKKQIFNILFFSIIIHSNLTLSSSSANKLTQPDFALTIKFFDAVETENIPEVQQLLAQGVSKDIYNNGVGDTALIVATRHQKREMVRFLIEQGFDKNAKNLIGHSALMVAAQNNDTDGIQDLCCVGTQKVDVDVKDEWKNTPLHIIADKDSYNGVFVLLKHGKADSHKKNYLGCIPLHTACARGALNAVKSLLSYGYKDQLAIEDKAGRSPLYWALANENYDVAEKLVKEDVLNDYSKGRYYTLLARLVHENNVQAVQKLLAMDVLKNKDQLLHIAAWRGNVSLLRLLIDAGLKIEHKDLAGWTPLHEATRCSHVEVLRVLLVAGADKNARTVTGRSVLYCAASRGNIEALKILLDAGVDKNITDNRGYTPCNFARICGHFQAAKFLEEYQPGAAVVASSSISEK